MSQGLSLWLAVIFTQRFVKRKKHKRIGISEDIYMHEHKCDECIALAVEFTASDRKLTYKTF